MDKSICFPNSNHHLSSYKKAIKLCRIQFNEKLFAFNQGVEQLTVITHAHVEAAFIVQIMIHPSTNGQKVISDSTNHYASDATKNDSSKSGKDQEGRRKVSPETSKYRGNCRSTVAGVVS